MQILEQNSNTTQLRTAITPTLENGTLKFNSADDAFDYMMELKEEIKTNEQQVIDDQTTLGFTSRLKIVKSLEEYDTTGSIFISPFLNAILNENYEVIIDDKIYTHKNHEETWIVPVNDTVSLAILRAKQPGSFIEDEDITSRMEIIGRREQRGGSCCTRFGVWPTRSAFESGFHTHMGKIFTLKVQSEIAAGSWWGIFVFGKCFGFEGVNNIGLALEVKKVFGDFRDSNCIVRYDDFDDDFCSSCKSLSEDIFHRFGTRNRFNDFEVGTHCRLIYASNMFVSVSSFPGCR